MPKTGETQQVSVFTYILASADMRYIENGEREVYLRNDPEKGFVFRGELAGCGPGCYVDLSQVLLEYAMNCEGCLEEGIGTEQAVHFGEHLADVLLETMTPKITHLPVVEKLATTFELTLNSMNATYTKEQSAGSLRYALTCCPLSDCGKSEGLGIGFEMARRSFTALSKSLVKALAPDCDLIQPTDSEFQAPIREVIIAGI